MKKYILVHQHSFGTTFYPFQTTDTIIEDGVGVSEETLDKLTQALNINFEPDTETIEVGELEEPQTISL